MADGFQASVARIAGGFAIGGEYLRAEEIDSGHINSTFRAVFRGDGGERSYLVQRINGAVFGDPRAVMRNVERVTRHLREKVAGGAGGRTLELCPARDGRAWVEAEDGGIWRCYHFIEGCVTRDVVADPREAWQAAWAFGRFQQLVSDLPAAEIVATIPDFHHTPKRHARLMEAAAADPCGRAAAVAAELDFARMRQADCAAVTDLLESGAIPWRITHNDTKLNNVMLDAASGEAVCVIDLDTVMPGSALYDFGDLVRSAVSPAAEDERDLSKVELRLPMFEALADGYLAAASGFLNEAELGLLVTAGKLITLETGMRFLTDHLEGDRYFRIGREGQNLDRCRTQFRLVAEIERRRDELEAIVRKARR